MTKLSFCGASERGDLELSPDGKTIGNSEDGKRNYTCTQNTCHYLNEFCASGTIHGIRYFAENRTLLEKLWWFFSITVSLYFCIDLIISAYIRWETSPVIVSFATKESPVWTIPFPAVTICPESKARASAFNYTAYFHKKLDQQPLTPDEEKKFGYLSYICDNSNVNLLNFTSGRYADEDIYQFFDQVQPQFQQYASNCKFLGKPYNCTDLFVPIITDDGICHTFNIMDRSQLLSDKVVHYKNYHQTTVSSDWDLETGYQSDVGLEAYPRRALFAGIPNALEVQLQVDEDDIDYTCSTSSVKGFKVQIAHPQRMPRVKQQHFIVPLNRVAKAGVAPDMMTTSEAVKHYQPHRRNCHFPSERSLNFFKVYAQNNCQIECVANYTLKACGCVHFYMPRENGTRICGMGSFQCIKEAENKLMRGSIQKKIDAINGKSGSYDDIPDCQCLPICTSMYYNVENTQANWDWRKIHHQNRLDTVELNNTKKHLSMLQVFFKGNQFIFSERNELYGSTEFLANVGGLLGLFVGFSALSFVEIAYYLTLRIICNVILFGKRNWSGKID